MSVFIALLLHLGILFNANDFNPDMMDIYQQEVIVNDVAGI